MESILKTILEFLKLLLFNPILFAAIVITGMVILLIPPILGVDFSQFRKENGPIVLIIIIICSSILLLKFLLITILEYKKKKKIIAFLDTLSEEEREVLRHYYEKGSRTFSGSIGDPNAVSLINKGILETPQNITNPLQVPFTITDYVWKELQKRGPVFFEENK